MQYDPDAVYIFFLYAVNLILISGGLVVIVIMGEAVMVATVWCCCHIPIMRSDLVFCYFLIRFFHVGIYIMTRE